MRDATMESMQVIPTPETHTYNEEISFTKSS